MPVTKSSSGVQVTLRAGRVLKVSSTNKAAVDTVSGVLGAGFMSKRVLRGDPVQIGPFQADAVLRVRAIAGHASYTDVPSTPVPLPKAGRSVGAGGGNMKAFSTSVTTGGSSKNWAGALSAWGPFHAVQLVFLNHTANPATIDNCIVGASSTAYPGGTFNLNAPDQGWGAPSGPVVIPPATLIGTRTPGIGLTPVMPARSVPRAAGELDGGLFELLNHRTVTLQGNATACYGDLSPGNGLNFPALYDPDNEGFSILTTAPNGGDDYVSTPAKVAAWNFGGLREVTPGVIVFGAVFHYDQPMPHVMGVGDSTMEGDGDGGSKRAPYLFKACARIRKSGKLLSYFNAGISGSTMAQINRHGKDLIATMGRPDVMVLHSYTPNSSLSTQAAWDEQWQLVMDLTQAQLDAGGKVMLITPLPLNGLNAAQNDYRMIQRQRVLDSGLPHVDIESLANAAGGWANAAHTQDGTHPLRAGHEALSDLVQPVLNELIP